MKIHSYNEWDQLREIYVGVATHANWPTNDPVFANESEKTLWKETPVPSGPVPDWIINEANEDLDLLAKILDSQGVVVNRPSTTLNFQTAGGMYNYCPRDRFLIAGDVIVDPAMMYPCRDMEELCYTPMLDDNTVVQMPRGAGMTLDAANICRLGDTWIYLESESGNTAAYDWLCAKFPLINIEKVNFYSGVHIDSTIVPLREGLVLCNKVRVKSKDYLPPSLKNWDVIWVDDMVPQSFHEYPYASKWIGLNMLAVNSDTVIMDAAQETLINTLEKHKFTVIPHTLRHSRTLGGGHHCVTLDTWREND
jgi:N-dimethylarginine dimethylaminohydrolase